VKIRRIALVLVPLVALLAAGAARAQDFDSGMAAYRTGDYGTAWSVWEALAEQGNTDAQNGLALMLENGQGVDQSTEKAFEWYLKAAEAGDAHAQFMVATLYGRGAIPVPDRMERLRWYYKAAKQGHFAARVVLSMSLHEGKGTPKDNILAYFWAQRAAEEADEATMPEVDRLIETIFAEMSPEEIQEADRRLAQARNEAWRSCLTDDE